MIHIRIKILGLLIAATYLCSAQASLMQQAMEAQQAGEYEKAAQAYREFLQAEPNETAAHVNLGVVLAKLGRFDEAIAEYQAADKLLPGDSRIALNLALAYEKSGRVSQAAERFAALHQADGADARITMLLADCRLQMGENESVVSLLEPLEKQNPDDLGIAYMLGMALLRTRRISEGQVRLDRILGKGDSAESRFLLGTRMYESGDYPGALQQFKGAVALNPNLPELQAFYGQALLNTGDADGAIKAFQEELASNPNNYAANLGLGQILTVRKQFSQAGPLLERACLARPESAEAKLSLQAAREHRSAGAMNGSADAADAGPKLHERAPDFALANSVSGKKVSLHDFRGKSPVVLIFGSYTCPNFRSAADALKSMQKRYGSHIPFLLVYIREAHAGNNWQSTRNEREGVSLAPAATMADKQNHAQMCSRTLHLPFPALVDGMDGSVETAYNAWPSRAFVVDKEGRVVYRTRLTELSFDPEAMDKVLGRLNLSDVTRK